MQRSPCFASTKTPPPIRARRGAIVVWFIVALPVVLTLLCVMLEVANLYLARQELHNALEAAAQAAVKDWADNGGGDTLQSRIVGNTYALANTINGVPVDLTTIDPTLNYAGAGQPCNQNTCNSGVLVFGAITSDNPDFVFNCCEIPSCGVGTVWFDVSGQSALGGSNNEWGISFQPRVFPVSPLRITRVIYTLPDTCEVPVGGGNNTQTVTPRFDFSSAFPAVSTAITDNDSNVVVQDNCPGPQGGPSAQSDVYGIDRSLVQFFIEVTDPCVVNNGIEVTNATNAMVSRTLAVQFPDMAGDLNGVDIFDRLRFGATVIDTGAGGGPNGGQLGGDAIGACMTQITICFNDGTSCTSMFTDTNDRSNQCRQCAGLAPWGINVQPPPNSATNRGLIIHPSSVPDLPCPPSSGNNNNGQSLANVVAGDCAFGGGGGTGRAFAVRAQTTYAVPSICCNLFGIPVGPFFVTAKADALYDCPTRTPRLYHLKPQNFICPLNCP